MAAVGGGTGVVGGVAQGAAAGAVFGPWGAAIGAGLGLIGGLTGGGGNPGVRVSQSQTSTTSIGNSLSVSPTIVNSFGGGAVSPNVGGSSSTPQAYGSPANSTAAGNDYLPTGQAGGLPLNPSLGTLYGANGQPVGTTLLSSLGGSSSMLIVVGLGLTALFFLLPKGK